MKKQAAIEYYKGVPALAAALDISRSAIYQWPADVPEGTACKLEILTGGELKAFDGAPPPLPVDVGKTLSPRGAD